MDRGRDRERTSLFAGCGVSALGRGGSRQIVDRCPVAAQGGNEGGRPSQRRSLWKENRTSQHVALPPSEGALEIGMLGFISGNNVRTILRC